MNGFKLTAYGVALLAFATTSCAGSSNGGETAGVASADRGALHDIMTMTDVRQYTGKPVADDTLRILLQAGMAAPTLNDRDVRKFVVVKSTAKRDLMAQRISTVGDKIKTAGAVVVVCGEVNPGADRAATELWVQDCAAATENIMLAANAFELGSSWCSVYPPAATASELRGLLGLPERFIPLCVITIGYPTALENPRERYNAENVITI